MTELSLNLRIGSVFIIWAAAAIGVGLPFALPTKDKDESPGFRCLKAGAAGVMLGIGLMHLLPEADEELSEVVPDYSLAFALTAFGVILNLTMEQVALMYLASCRTKPDGQDQSSKSDAPSNENIALEALEHGEHCGFVKCEHGSHADQAVIKTTPFANINSATLVGPRTTTPAKTAPTSNARGLKEQEEEAGSEEGAEELVASLVRAEGLRELVALYAMELSVSVHSIIIGVDIGLLAGGGSMTTLVALICAIAFHQCVEGLGLGAVLHSVRAHDRASLTKLAVFVVLFTCSAPVGIVIGICTSSQEESDAGTTAKGAASSLAAGSLLYLSLTEMLASYFASNDLAQRPALKLTMIAAFSLGVASMAIIAIWA